MKSQSLLLTEISYKTLIKVVVNVSGQIHVQINNRDWNNNLTCSCFVFIVNFEQILLKVRPIWTFV